ncbi:MAG: 2Fe-2S iron-sulfur cluster-binding protein, partial [Rhodospirillales bacterium]|nr:2Fe-2S iron-sulfur cluster-binding protein [Rhodospirillales bacterium]
GMSVLDALIWIRNNADPSLAFRYSCINANACKECVLKINGKTEYACTARLKPGTITVEPLANKRLLRDLVTDIVPPKERLKEAIAGRDKK